MRPQAGMNKQTVMLCNVTFYKNGKKSNLTCCDSFCAVHKKSHQTYLQSARQSQTVYLMKQNEQESSTLKRHSHPKTENLHLPAAQRDSGEIQQSEPGIM